MFLNNRLGNDLLSRGLNGLNSVLGVVFCWFYNWLLVDVLVLSSVKSYLNILSLNNRLNVSLVIDFSTWLIDCLGSCSILNLSLSGNGLSVDSLGLRWNKVYSFCVVYDRSLNDWLSNDFFGWSLEISVNSFTIKFSWSCNNIIVLDSGLSSLNI